MSDDEAQPEVQDWPETRVLKDILYCGVCSMPPEYCDYSGTTKKCKKWLSDEHPDVFSRLYPNQDLSKDLEEKATLKEGEEDVAEEGEKKKPKVQETKAEKERRKKAEAHVVICRIERTKRKRVITVFGLENFDVDLKKAAKLFATKFACGASVTKNPQGQDEIVVQGDVQDDIYELVRETWPSIPDDQIDMTEGKKK
ncbi:Translation machinery-associated protein 22 [Rhizophlyctis rosea]|uniref:Translation machinery-associated protein 22 n=1 Tax=Rhizophlyctis rosea TaxID=64517 RepID=A0AAD5S621_9FUNG|nr:Translation machinery-associated protein 22 [Rhizophlyctis rosea]